MSQVGNMWLINVCEKFAPVESHMETAEVLSLSQIFFFRSWTPT